MNKLNSEINCHLVTFVLSIVNILELIDKLLLDINVANVVPT